jgi:hypothetical protein
MGADPDVIASFLIAVGDGFALQWLLDPERTPDGEQLATALGPALASAACQRSSGRTKAGPTNAPCIRSVPPLAASASARITAQTNQGWQWTCPPVRYLVGVALRARRAAGWGVLPSPCSSARQSERMAGARWAISWR